MHGYATRSVAPVSVADVIAHSAGHGTSASFAKKVLVERERRAALGRRNQVERAELILTPPAAPVRQLLLPGVVLRLAHERMRRRALRGHVTGERRADGESAQEDWHRGANGDGSHHVLTA